MARKPKTELQKFILKYNIKKSWIVVGCLLYTSPSPRDS